VEVVVQTRREQVRAYRFVTRRIVSALLSGEPETTDLPMRRLGLALFSSVMFAAVVLAGVGAYGLLRPGGGTPEPNTLIIERETGARYVYQDDHRLYPVLNYASARLILGVANPEIRTMSQKSLRSLPRGRPVGISGAPDELPDRSALLGLPWSVCSAPRSLDIPAPATHLLVGSQPAGGTVIGDDALLVAVDADRYLIWHDLRLKVRDRGVLATLGFSSAIAIPVGQALINGITAGPDLAPFQLRDVGKPSSRRIKGQTPLIGQVYHVGDQHYVLTAEGLVTIGEVSALLFRAGGVTDEEITAVEAGRNQVDRRVEPEGLPLAVPQLHAVTSVQSAVCAGYRGGADTARRTVTVEVFDRVPSELSVSTSDLASQVIGGVRTADRVAVAGGHGALVQALPAAGATAAGATVYLVTDQGIKYALATRAPDAKTALGYGEVTPVQVPSSLLALIPTGPTLDPAAARSFTGRPAAPAPTSGSPRPPSSPSPSPGQSRPPSSPPPTSPQPSSTLR
jgi:type VII secretion protein EccB